MNSAWLLFRVVSDLPFHHFQRYLTSVIDLLKNKSRPEAASEGAAEWVKSEREMRERLKREREAREIKEKLDVCDAIPPTFQNSI